MKIGKTIKKVAALGIGLSFVGATMFGAMAADLSSYPSPFIKNGVFDGVLVVGTGGSDPAGLASDIIGVTDIVASLQYSSTTSSGTSANKVVVTGKDWKVGTASKVLELTEKTVSTAPAASETIYNITTNIGSDALDILGDGSISNNKGTFDYKQYLYFTYSSSKMAEYVKLMKNDNDVLADTFYIPSGGNIARYELEFTTDFESDIEDSNGGTLNSGTYLGDYENRVISIAGKDFTIVKARRTSSTSNGVELDLFGGSHKDTLDEGATKTITVNGKDYEVTALAITDVAPIIVKFQVNGETTSSLGKGSSDKLKDGTEIGVTDLIPNEAGDPTLDMVEFYLGSSKMILKDDDITDTASSNQLKVNDKTMTDVNVKIAGTMDSANSAVSISKIVVDMNADDNYYVQPGELLSSMMSSSSTLFPGSWDIKYAGLSDAATEKIELTPSGDNKYNLKFADANGNQVEVPLAWISSGSTMKLGDDSDDLILNESKVINKNDYVILTDSSQKDGNKNTYALRYIGATKNNSDSKVVKFKNLGTGDIIEKTYDSTVAINGNIASLTLGGQTYKIFSTSAGTLKPDSTNFDIKMDLDGSGGLGSNLVKATTDAGAELTIAPIPESAPTKIVFTAATVDQDQWDNIVPTPVSFNISVISSKIDLTKNGNLDYISPEDNSDLNIAYTSLGAYVEWNKASSDPDSLKITYPKSQKAPVVLLTSEGSTGVTSTAGSENVNINRIEVGSAKLDSELSDVTAQNVIAIGGSCVNSATAKLVGVAPGTCGQAGADALGLRENKAILKVMDQSSGKVALIVAGWRAEDTRRACKVLANYQDYTLSGSVMEVSGTTLSDIKVGAPVAVTTTTTAAPAVTTTTVATP